MPYRWAHAAGAAREGITVNLRLPRTAATVYALVVVSSIAASTPAAAQPPNKEQSAVIHESWHRLVTTQHDFNICGDLATFTFESTGHATAVDTGNGFHFTFTDVDFYTVDFDDPTLGTWTARATETSHFNATPGDVVTLHVGNNNIEGDVRIRELQTLVIGPGGEVRVDRAVAEVVGC
jgi:hypothetical protein